MGAVWMRARGDLGRRWRSGVGLVLLVGLVAAVVLTAAAGARRTATSFDRFLAQSKVSDAFVVSGEAAPQQVRDFARAPYISAISHIQTLQLVYPDGTFPNAGAPVDDRLGSVFERARILEGRAADPKSTTEITINESIARQQHLHVGDTLALSSFTPAQIDAQRTGTATDIPEPGGPAVRLRVVGISRLPSDLGLDGTHGGILLLTPGFGRRYASQIGSYGGDLLAVRLRHGGADFDRFARRATRFFGEAPAFAVQPSGQGDGGVRQSTDVLALGVAIFAGVAALAGLTALGLVLRRRIDVDAGDQEVLRSLGLTRARRALAVGVPAVPVTLVGAALGVLGAWLASPVLPMGLARKAEPHPGMHFDGLVLGVGFLAVVGVLLAITGLVAWRAARVLRDREGAPTRPTVVARLSASLGLRPTASIGAAMALERSGRRAGVPVRSALVGAVAAVLGISAVLVFGASLDRLVTTPARYGFHWDARVLDDHLRSSVPDRPCTVRRSRLTSVPGVGDVAAICSISVELGGRPVVAFGVRSLRGVIEPTIVEGRAPRGPREVAIGAQTLADLGRGVGDRVRAPGPNGPLVYRIVGVAAAPRFDDPFSDPLAVDRSAFFTGAGLDALDDPTDGDASSELLINVAPGADRDAVLRRVERLKGVSNYGGTPGVSTALVPLEVARVQQIDTLPAMLAGFLALLGVVSVGFVLASSVRRRGRELAILKTLGFSRRQVSATIAWQSTTMAAVGVLIGIPLGVIVGRVIWRSIAQGIGVVSTPDVPVGLLAVVALMTIVLANLIAALPAWAAARTRPATVLRSE